MTLNVSSSAITIKNSSGTEKVNFSTQELVLNLAAVTSFNQQGKKPKKRRDASRLETDKVSPTADYRENSEDILNKEMAGGNKEKKTDDCVLKKLDEFRHKFRRSSMTIMTRMRRTIFILLKMYPEAIERSSSSVFDKNYLLCALYSAKHWK